MAKKKNLKIILVVIGILLFLNSNQRTQLGSVIPLGGNMIESFDNPSNFGISHNIDLSGGTLKVAQTSTYTPFPAATQEADTTFLLTFDNGFDADFSTGNGAQKSSRLPTIVSDDFGNAASFSGDNILWFEGIGNMPTTDEWTIEMMLKTDNSQFNGNTLLDIHDFFRLMMNSRGVLLNPPDSFGGKFLHSYEGTNWDNEWHKTMVTSTTRNGINEMYFFVDGQLVNYKYADEGDYAYQNSDYGFGLAIGGITDSTTLPTSSNFDLVIDNVRISNTARFPQVVNTQEQYTIHKSFIESEVIDTGVSSPDLSIVWDEISQSEGARASIHFMFSDDGVNFERFIPHPTISLSQDGTCGTTGSTAFDNVFPVFQSRGYTGSLAVQSSSCTFLDEMHNAGWDIGIELNPTQPSTINSLHSDLVSNSWNHFVFRPFFNNKNRDIILTLSSNFKYSHNQQSFENDGNYFDNGMLLTNRQVDTDLNAFKSAVDDAVDRDYWRIITYHSIDSQTLPNAWLDYAESRNVEVLNVVDTLNTYMAQDNTGSVIDHQYTKRYFKYYIFLYSGTGSSTPIVDNLEITLGTPQQCNTEADTNCDGEVSNSELVNYISRWTSNQVTNQELLEAIGAWMDS